MPDPKSIGDKSSWSFIFFPYSLFSLYLTLGECVRQNFRPIETNVRSSFLPINWVFSLFCLRIRRKRKIWGHTLVDRSEQNNQFFFLLFLLNERNYVHRFGQIEDEEKMKGREGEKTKEKGNNEKRLNRRTRERDRNETEKEGDLSWSLSSTSPTLF